RGDLQVRCFLDLVGDPLEQRVDLRLTGGDAAADLLQPDADGGHVLGCEQRRLLAADQLLGQVQEVDVGVLADVHDLRQPGGDGLQDRKSTRLNSSHVKISYAVFCLK